MFAKTGACSLVFSIHGPSRSTRLDHAPTKGAVWTMSGPRAISSGAAHVSRGCYAKPVDGRAQRPPRRLCDIAPLK